LGVVTRPFRPSIRHVGTLIYPKGRSKDRLVSSFVDILKAVTLEDRRALATPHRPMASEADRISG